MTEEQKAICAKYQNDKYPGFTSLAPYVDYHPGDTSITLDGDFTAEELIAFATYMQEKLK